MLLEMTRQIKTHFSDREEAGESMRELGIELETAKETAAPQMQIGVQTLSFNNASSTLVNIFQCL